MLLYSEYILQILFIQEKIKLVYIQKRLTKIYLLRSVFNFISLTSYKTKEKWKFSKVKTS